MLGAGDAPLWRPNRNQFLFWQEIVDLSVRKMRRVLLLALACSAAVDLAAGQAPPEELSVQLLGEVGASDNLSARVGRVAGLYLGANGSLLVTDDRNHSVFVVGAKDGTLFAFGAQGSGPGDLLRPCCTTIASDGSVWVRDVGNRRINVYQLGADWATPLFTVATDPNPAVFPDRMSLLDGQAFVDLASRVDTGGAVYILLQERSRSRGVRSERRLLRPPAQALSEVRVNQRGATTVFVPPFHSKPLWAFASNGEYVVAASGLYEVRWYDKNGRIRHVVSERATGPLLSPRERSEATEVIRGIERQAGASASRLGISVPSRKPVLKSMVFDLDGRLWIFRAAAEGAGWEADLFSADGLHSATVSGPSDVDASYAAFRGLEGFAVQSLADGEERVVRVRLVPRKPPE